MNKFLISFYIGLSFYFPLKSQNLVISGKFIDGSGNTALPGVNVALSSKTAAIKWQAVATDAEGNFRFSNLAPGQYSLKATFIGYKTVELSVNLKDKDKNLGILKIYQGTIKTKEVVIAGKEVRASQKGDTTEYNSNAFKTTKDATTEDLVTKLPGVTVDNGNIKAHGENVQKVLIDGKEIFGDDPTIAIRNLPAEIIDKIQIYDRLSDQSQFTGFDDGNSQKTMNIITRQGKNQGVFGKLYAGYGTDDRYTFGGGLNFFNGKRRISILGLDNNINQQNFSAQDLLGLSGSSNQFRGNMTTGRSSRGRTGSSAAPGGSFGGAQNNFLVGNQAGINTTQSIGLNYIDQWGKKINVSFSYFFNNSNNSTSSILQRQYFQNNLTSQIYKDTNDGSSNNFNHRFSLRLEYTIDSSNSIIFQPRFNLQEYHTTSFDRGLNLTPENSPLSKTVINSNSDISGNNFSGSLLLRHKFHKAGRTLSLNIGANTSDKTGNNRLLSKNDFYGVTDSTSLYDQKTVSTSNGYTYSADLNYTEPLNKNSILQFNYSPSWSKNNSDKETNNLDTFKNEYSIFDTNLSNKFLNNVLTQRAGVNYRLKGTQYNFTVGVNYQNTALSSEETFPYALQINKTFDNILPSVNFQYKFSKISNLRMFYRTSINTPSITQLQNVVDNSNPLFLSSGNPDLREEYRQNFILRYAYTNTEKSRMFFAFLSGGFTNNYIGNSTIIASNDTFLKNNVLLHNGSQYSMPVNLQGSWNVNSFLTFGFPVKILKSNLNLNAGVTFSQIPSMINHIKNESNNLVYTGGFVLGSNISEKLDFTLSYSANYNTAKNSIQPQLNNNYFNHTAGFRINWLPVKWLVISSDATNSLYSGLGSAYDKNIFLWNAGLGYKFLKNQAAELRFSVFDLLNQNNSITRTINDTYIEDNRTQVLTRYFMLTFTYTMRYFH